MLDRGQKPQTDRSKSIELDRSKGDPVNHRRLQVKREWHISSSYNKLDRGRLTTIKPCTPSAFKPVTINQAQSRADLVPNLVPNRAFPFIKHAGEQAALGLHKPIGLILASAYLLGAACQLSGMPIIHITA